MTKDKSADDPLIAAAKTAFQTPFGAKLLLAPEDDADKGQAIIVNGAETPPSVKSAKNRKTPADCTWRGSQETLLRVLDGERALESAYVAGRIKISGDMGVMARLKLGAPK